MDYLSLCLICKDENDYLPEWLDYHIAVGVDRFYIYDNESQVSLRESLKDYIARGWVVVVDIPGSARQLYAYDHCLHTFGEQTFWMGFIDADEFLVPRLSLNLKDLLKEYESFGGLAVSSLFFGSNEHQTRPQAGQLVTYTRRTHATFKDNELVKSIVQPARVEMPVSPHDFVYRENSWCVNEGFLRVDFQRFPNRTEKIQLNHYYCRSEEEIDAKIQRGNSGAVAWPRKRFDAVNLLAGYEDTSILQVIDTLVKNAGIAGLQAGSLLEKISGLARIRSSSPLAGNQIHDVVASRPEFVQWMDLKSKIELARARGDHQEVCQLLLRAVELYPGHINLYIDLSINYLLSDNPETAWQVLTRAWQLAPQSNAVLAGMAFYFFRVKNYDMVEKTCRLVLEIDPNNLMILGFLTEAFIGQGRVEEALKVGLPVVELSAVVGELPEYMGIYLVKKLARLLLEKKDYAGAARLWESGVKCQPGDPDGLLELARCLVLAGDWVGAGRCLAEAGALAPQNQEIKDLMEKVNTRLQAKTSRRRKNEHER